MRRDVRALSALSALSARALSALSARERLRLRGEGWGLSAVVFRGTGLGFGVIGSSWKGENFVVEFEG